MTTLKRTKELMSKYNIRINKDLGQNFLVDDEVIERIISEAEITKETCVVEIGPGLGALTFPLINKCKKIVAIELDEKLASILLEEIKSDNFVLYNEDILKIDMNKVLAEFDFTDQVVVISNLPYYITTPVIFRLLENNYNIIHYVLMVQKEVGKRLTSKPRTKEYNALTVLMNYKTKTGYAFNVSKNCFIPIPNVESSVIKMKYFPLNLGIHNDKLFLKFISDIFANRRKTLVNNISASNSISKSNLNKYLVDNNYKETIRSEELTLIDIANIYKGLFQNE
ncbi:MAG: 16S rRNA (adenine(1518)-N(6)/adenine(1519)-N(6))-dimethyltransferase RsmA [Bacilli bacterium]